MELIEILTYVFIIIGTLVNVIFGIVYKIDFTLIMLRNIIITISFMLLGYISSKTLKNMGNRNSIKLNKKKYKSSFQYDIPPITKEELKEISEEDAFKEVNPAALYIKNQEE